MYAPFCVGGDGKRTRFHQKKTRWGFRKLISLDSFKDAESGYLFGDSCEFGAEVFVVPKYTQKDQCLSMIKPPVTMNTHVWTISKFSLVKEDTLYSEDFKVGKVKWYIICFNMFICTFHNMLFPYPIINMYKTGNYRCILRDPKLEKTQIFQYF